MAKYYDWERTLSYDAAREMVALRDENEKLRHLVDDVLHNIRGCKHDPDCGWCDFDECPYDRRARELGIEVNG